MEKLVLNHVIFLNSSFRYIFDDEPVKEDETKHVLAKQYGGEEEVISISLCACVCVGGALKSLMPTFASILSICLVIPALPH